MNFLPLPRTLKECPCLPYLFFIFSTLRFYLRPSVAINFTLPILYLAFSQVMEAVLTYNFLTVPCTASWLHLNDEDEMFQPDNEDAKFVYKLKFDTLTAQRYGWDSAVFKTGPFLNTELETYNRLKDLQGELIPKLYGKASLQIRNKTLHGILIEFVEGKQLYDYSSTPGYLTKDSISKIEAQVEEFISSLNERGVQHGDPRGSNMLLHQPNTSAMRIMFIDFDNSITDKPKDKIADGNNWDKPEWIFWLNPQLENGPVSFTAEAGSA